MSANSNESKTGRARPLGALFGVQASACLAIAAVLIQSSGCAMLDELDQSVGTPTAERKQRRREAEADRRARTVYALAKEGNVKTLAGLMKKSGVFIGGYREGGDPITRLVAEGNLRGIHTIFEAFSIAGDRLWRTRYLYSFIRNGHPDVAKIIVSTSQDLNRELSIAVAEELPEAVECLLAHGADPNSRMDYVSHLGGRALSKDTRLLHYAAMTRNKYTQVKGKSKMMEILLSHGADVNATDSEGKTPLHWAVTVTSEKTIEHFGFNYREIVMLLLDKGADVNAKDNEGKTPLAIAISSGNEEVAALLRRHGAKE